jgi:hypothetical protein
LSILQEVADGIHFLVRNTDDIDGVLANEVKHDVLSFWEVVEPLADVGSVFAKFRIFSEPVEASFNTL